MRARASATAVAAVVATMLLGAVVLQPRVPVLRTASAPTRVLTTFGSAGWAANGSAALDAFRSDLMPRMFWKYLEAEKELFGGKQGAKREIRRVEPPKFGRYDLFDPIVRCPRGDLTRVGDDGDGGKLMCVDARIHKPGCLILSIGSNGQYDFEEALLKESACEIHTFDCTYDGKSMHKRHTYHKICLGDKSEKKPMFGGQQFMTLADIVRLLGNRPVDLLKMDVEGFEYEIVSGFKVADSCNFPNQISIELHWGGLYGWKNPIQGDRNHWTSMIWPKHTVIMAELAVFFNHFASMGYAIISREDNALQAHTGCCSEFTLIRVEQPAHCRV